MGSRNWKTNLPFTGLFQGKICLAIIVFATVVILFTTYLTLSNLGNETSSNPAAVTVIPVQPSSKNYYFPEAKNRSTVPKAGFAFLALGAQANQMNCPAAIETLVRFAGWDGDVFLITDQSHCFDHATIIRQAGMKHPEKFHYIVTPETFSHGGFDWQHPTTIGFRQSRVRSLAMKTQLFEIIDRHDSKHREDIDTLAYVDCDILFQEEGCARDFLVAGGVDWQEYTIRFSHVTTTDSLGAVMQQTANPKGRVVGALVDIHAGSFVVHREHSKEVLAVWRRQIEEGLDEGDNDAYLRAYHQLQLQGKGLAEKGQGQTAEQRNSSSQRHHSRRRRSLRLHGDNNHLSQHRLLGSSSSPHSSINNNNHPNNHSLSSSAILRYDDPHNLLMPGVISKGLSADSDDQQNWFEKFLELENPRSFCMNHVPKARCSRYGRKAIQRQFVDRFRLRSYQSQPESKKGSRDGNGYFYCTSPALQPMLYGWFPTGYLPYCPKIEKIL